MSLTLADVTKIARLARIAVSEQEIREVQEKLNGIFALIEQMQAVDTKGVAPMAHAQDVTQRLREDLATEPDRRDDFQAIAPAVGQGLYLVPKVIE